MEEVRNRETGTRFPNQRALILVIVIEGMPVLFDHQRHHYHHHHHHLSLNREGLLGATNNFTTSFLQFSLFSTALWDLPNSRHVHSLTLSSYLFRLPCLLPPFTVHVHSVCVSLHWSGGLRVVRLPAGSWHGLPRW